MLIVPDSVLRLAHLPVRVVLGRVRANVRKRVLILALVDVIHRVVRLVRMVVDIVAAQLVLMVADMIVQRHAQVDAEPAAERGAPEDVVPHALVVLESVHHAQDHAPVDVILHVREHAIPLVEMAALLAVRDHVGWM